MLTNLTPIALIILGVILSFFGFKIQKVAIAIAWAMLGYTLAKSFGHYIVDTDKAILIMEIVCAIIFAGLGYKLEKISLFIAVAYYAYITIGPYITFFEPLVNKLVTIGAGLICGGLAVIFMEKIIIIITGAFGANLIKVNLPKMVSLPTNIVTIIFIAVLICGILFQFRDNN